MWRPMKRGALALLLAGLAGCGGGGGGSVGPGGGISVVFGGGVSQPGFALTLRKVEVLFDGKVAGRSQASPAEWMLVPQGSKSNVARGVHTVSFRIADQAVSPMDYTVEGIVNASDQNGGTQTITLGPVTQGFATGDMITFSVTIDP